MAKSSGVSPAKLLAAFDEGCGSYSQVCGSYSQVRFRFFKLQNNTNRI